MEEDNCAQTALDVMADMLKERGYDYSYAQELEGTSLIYRDKAGNYHDCWGAGSSELVNVPIAVTPEQALSVDDLNGIIDENAKLKDYARECLAAIIGWTWAINEFKGIDIMDDSSPATQTMKELLKRAKELGVET